jgi:hypothetical protein
MPHSRRWYTADQEVNGIEGNTISHMPKIEQI